MSALVTALAIGEVTLRPVAADELDLLGRWRNDPEHETEFGDFLPMHRRQTTYRQQWHVDGLLTEETGLLMICLDGQPVGSVDWRTVRYGANHGSQALALGISIAPGVRGKGVGTAAQRLACEWLFRQTTVHRIEASTDVENIAEQRALEKAGFSREGISRDAQFRGGRRHDLIQYSRLRTDPAPD